MDVKVIKSQGNELEINALRIDPNLYAVRVIDVFSVLNKKVGTNYSLRELASVTKSVAFINGGFTGSYSFPAPAGLLVRDGKTISRLNSLSTTQAGVLCVVGSKLRIIKKEKYKETSCGDAIQAGPHLVEESGKVGISTPQARKSPRYRRSVIAIDKEGRAILVATNEVTLFDLASLLAKSEAGGGLGVVSALNLSGDVESGMFFREKKSEMVIGNIDALLTSAIAIETKVK